MNIKKIASILATLLFLFSCAETFGKDTRSLLWKVSGNGLKSPSYLFGTHHLVSTDFLDSIQGLEKAFEATEQTVGEMDLSSMTEMQMKIMMAAVMPENKTYHSLLNEEDFELLDQTMKNLMGVGLEQFGTMKPAMLNNLITITLYQKYYPSLSQTTSIDQYFQDEAAKRQRSIIGLETIDDQIDLLLNSQTIERQAEMLICLVKHPDLLKEQMNKLQTAYYKQDIKKLNDLFEEKTPDDPCPSTQEEKDAMNKNRNEKWLKQLPPILQDKSSFIAVGCLHLVGNNGLIEGLRKQGYTVEPVE